MSMYTPFFAGLQGQHGHLHPGPILQLIFMTPRKPPRISTNLLPTRIERHFNLSHTFRQLTDFGWSRPRRGSIVVMVGIVFVLELGEGVCESQSGGVGFGFRHA
jgi:hypothetical protein